MKQYYTDCSQLLLYNRFVLHDSVKGQCRSQVLYSFKQTTLIIIKRGLKTPSASPTSS